MDFFFFFMLLKSAPVISSLGSAAAAIFFCFGDIFLPYAIIQPFALFRFDMFFALLRASAELDAPQARSASSFLVGLPSL